MKKSFLLSLAGMAVLMILPVQGMNSVMRLESDVAGIRYGVYADEDCLIPLVDENSLPIEAVSNEDGILSCIPKTSEPFYLRQSGTVKGYYLDPQIYSSGQDRFILPVYPIEAEVDCGDLKEGTFQIYDEKKEVMIMEWSLEDCENPSVEQIGDELEAGHGYVLVQKDLPEWMYGQELPFQIPEYAEEKIVLQPQQVSFGKVHFTMNGLNPEHDFVYQLFLDETCSEPALTISGNEVRMDQTGPYEFFLKEGTYWLKAIQEDVHYLPVAVHTVSLKEKQETQINLDHTIIAPVLTLLDEQMNPLEGNFEVTDESGEVMHVASQQSVVLKRNHTYTITAVNVPSGYYIPSSIHLETVYENGIVNNIDVTASGFTVTLFLKDQQTEQGIGGSEFAVYDEMDQLLSTVHTDHGQAVLTGLHAGKSYRIHQIRTTDTWLPVQDQILSIPYSGDSYVQVFFFAQGYVHLNASVVNEKQAVISSGIISVYDDPSCTVVSLDIHGKPISAAGILQADVYNGTYYLSLDEIDDTWYLLENAVSVTVDHAVGVNVEASLKSEKVDSSFQIRDDQGNDVEGFTVELYENGTFIHRIRPDGTSISSQGIQLKRNHDYQLRYVCLKGQYVYADEMQPLSVSSTLPSDRNVNELTVIPYVSLHVLDEMDGLSTRYRVYMDAECTEEAVNLTGTEKTSHNTWNLGDGTYWVKTESIGDCWYPSSVPMSIRLDHSRSWNENMLMKHTPVTMVLTSVDEEGQALDDTMVEIRSTDGTLMETGVFTEGMLVLQGTWLHKGKSYVVSEVQTPSGYLRCADIQFTVPFIQPSMIPSVTIVHQKQQRITLPQLDSGKTTVKKEEPQKEESVRNPENRGGLLTKTIIATGIAVSAYLVLKNISGRKV